MWAILGAAHRVRRLGLGISDSFYKNNKVSVKWGQLQSMADFATAQVTTPYLNGGTYISTVLRTPQD